MRERILPLLLILATLSCHAADRVHLYSGEAAVADQGSAEREGALPRALEQVLQKLSGLRQFEGYALVAPALSRAPELLLSYHYREVQLPQPDGGVQEDLRLVARFSESAVDQMARELELPFWPPVRRPLLVWMVIDDGLGRRIMPVEFLYAQQLMSDVADGRGMLLEWPRPDEDGAYPVDDQILWGGYTEDLVAAPGQGILIAAARREGPEWTLRVNLGYRGQHWTWRLNDIYLEAALTEGTQIAIDQIAAVDSIAAADLGRWRQEITVTGLADAEDYRRCINYLQGISIVDGVEAISARAGSVSLRLDLTAAPRYLEESLESGGFLLWTEEDRSYRLAGSGSDDR
jgi:hypothetical protein